MAISVENRKVTNRVCLASLLTAPSEFVSGFRVSKKQNDARTSICQKVRRYILHSLDTTLALDEEMDGIGSRYVRV